jgi:predicted amidohydrolase
VLPEMAFSGYVFDSEEEVKPFLEKFDSGPTFQYCSKIAKKFKIL